MLSDFLKELHRRRVVRVSVAYLIAAWLVIQVSATTFPILQLPDWSVRLVLVLVLLGFPVAVALSWAFDLTDSGIERTRALPYSSADAARIYARVGLPGRPPFLAGRTRYLVAGTLMLVLVLSVTGWFALTAGEAGGDALDDGLVAVLPFRVSGADPAFAYLREGMVDLLAVKLDGSRRAVDPRTTLAAFRGAVTESDPTLNVARGIATTLRAGHLLLGSVVGGGGTITINASLIRTRDGREVAARPVTGHPDSLQVLVDRLVAALLSLEAGESERRLDLLTSTSLPALRTYLEGNAALRRGEYKLAVEKYDRAIVLDSTFVLPGLQLPEAASMTFGVPASVTNRAIAVVRQNRDRLSSADRAFADVRWPEQPFRSVAESLEGWESLARTQPDRPEVWYHLGDIYFHQGALLGIDDADARARAAFEQALRLDPAYFLPRQHLVWLAHEGGDTAYAVTEMQRYLASDPQGISAAEFRHRIARIRGDTAYIRRVGQELPDSDQDVLIGVALFNQLWPYDGRIQDAWTAVDAMTRRAASASDLSIAALNRYQLALNAGQPAGALRALRSVVSPTDDPRRVDQHIVYAAVYWDGDTIAARAAHERLQQALVRPAGSAEKISVAEANTLCAMLTWRLWRGVADGAETGIATLMRSTRVADSVCGTKLDALHAAVRNAPNAAQRLAALDSLMRTGPAAGITRDHANLTVARLAADAGDYALALNATRRVLHSMNGQYYRSTFLELEGRYAAALGRKEEAAHAWTGYLLLRADPEPAVSERVDRVRRELAALSADRR